MKQNQAERIGRRGFLKSSGAAVIGSTLAIAYPRVVLLAASVLKVGLIGCGGRGTGAAAQALQADPNVLLTAMGDVFEDRLEESYKALLEEVPTKLKVEKATKFIGFDAYQKVIDSGVDVVLLATPPGFRPQHLMAAIDAGKHVFCEKPVAVDAPGVRKVLEAAKKAKEKKLSLVSGFTFRYDYSKRALFDKILRELSAKLFQFHLREMEVTCGIFPGKLPGPTWSIKCEIGIIKTGCRVITLWR